MEGSFQIMLSNAPDSVNVVHDGVELVLEKKSVLLVLPHRLESLAYLLLISQKTGKLHVDKGQNLVIWLMIAFCPKRNKAFRRLMTIAT